MSELKRISAWVAPATKTAFNHLAQLQGNSESGLLSLLVTKVLETNSAVAKDSPEVHSAASTVMKDRVTVRFLATEWAMLEERSRVRGLKSSAYLRILFRTHASQTPYFTVPEVDVLREANHQLAAIGRNLNQIAKALNTSLDDTDIAKAYDFEMMKDSIGLHRESVKALLRVNLRSWGISE